MTTADEQHKLTEMRAVYQDLPVDSITHKPKHYSLRDSKYYTYPENTREQTYFIPGDDLKIKAIYDYWAFVELIQFKGGRNAFSDMHFEMAHFNTFPQQENWKLNRRRLNLVPRGHLKSTQNTVGYTLWRVYRNPNIRICVDTATKDLALQFVREIKQYFEDEHLQDTVWNSRPQHPGNLIPILDKAGQSRRNKRWDLGDYSEASDKKIIWRADAIQVMRSDVMREPTVLAASPGSNITGMHFDVIIMDDIINDDTVATPEKIAKTLRQIQDLESVLDPQRSVVIGEIAGKKIKEVVGDEQVINGTRYAKDDYYGYLQENLEYLGYKLFWRNIYVNKIDDSDGYVWGEKFNADHIEMLKRRAGAIRFSSQYLNKVIASEEVIFSQSMLSTFRADLSDMSQYGIIRLKIFNHEKKDFDYIDVKPYLIIDPAISQKKTADNSVIMVGGVDFARNLYVIDFKCGKFLPDDIVEKTYELAFKWSLKSIHIEVVSFQQALVYMFKTRFVDHFPLAVNEYRPRGEKKARIQTHLHPLFVNKKIWLAHWMQHHQELVDELNYFPSNTVHDDILDAMAMIVEIASPTPDKRKRRAAYDHFQANSKYGGRVR